MDTGCVRVLWWCYTWAGWYWWYGASVVVPGTLPVGGGPDHSWSWQQNIYSGSIIKFPFLFTDFKIHLCLYDHQRYQHPPCDLTQDRLWPVSGRCPWSHRSTYVPPLNPATGADGLGTGAQFWVEGQPAGRVVCVLHIVKLDIIYIYIHHLQLLAIYRQW